MVMGDLVLTESEVEPVMLKLQESGISQSAIHNHLIGESPELCTCTLLATGIPFNWPRLSAKHWLNEDARAGYVSCPSTIGRHRH